MSVQAITWAYSQRVGSPTGKAVLLCLANYADKHGACFPGHDTIAWECEISRRAVVTWMNQLEAMGLLTRQRRFREDGCRTSDSVVLNLSRQATTTDSGPSAECAHGGKEASPSAPDARPSAPDDLHHVHQVHSNRKGNRKKEPDSPLTPQGGDDLFDLFWNAFSEGQRGSSRRAVEARFQRAVKVHPGLSDQIIDAVKLYRLHCYARSVPACAERFLRRKTYETYIDTPPDFDKGGDWIITPDRPEWGPWMGFQRDNHGDERIGQIARIGRMLVKTRWPDGYARQQEQAA